MLDLFAGRGGASRAMVERGWSVTRVELDERFPAEHRDIRTFRPEPGAFDLVWASPPCTEFSRYSLPWVHDKTTPSLELVDHALRVISAARPTWWALENVRGSLRWLRPILGEPVAHLGPVFLWGEPPLFVQWPVHVGAYKTLMGGKGADRASRRSEIPRPISEALAIACERHGRAA